MNINKHLEWEKAKFELEARMRYIGENVRAVRCNSIGRKFRGVTLEGRVNILYNMETRKVAVWGTAKRCSNGYIEYEKLIEQIEIFKEFMDKMEY